MSAPTVGCPYLVEQLPPEEPEPTLEYVDLEEVMTSFDIGEIMLARSVLDDYQISYLVQGDYFSTCCGSWPATILVSKDNVNKAKELLQDFL